MQEDAAFEDGEGGYEEVAAEDGHCGWSVG